MTTGRLDFGDLVENVGASKLSDIVIGAGYIGSILATLPLDQRARVASMLTDVLGENDERLPCMSKFVVEVVANTMGNLAFADWALQEVTNMVN